MKAFLSLVWPFLIASLGGLLLAFCFAPFNWADLVWGSSVCLLAGLWLGVGVGEKRRKRKGFLIGWLAGFVFWVINLKWLYQVAGGAYLLLAFYLAFFFALFGMFASTVGNPFGKAARGGGKWEVALRSLGFSALNGVWWCGLEWLRGFLFTGFGWNGLGVTFHSRLPLAQGAELVGVTGLAFLPIFVGGVIVQVGMRLCKGVKVGKVERHWDFAGAVLFLIVCFGYGVTRMAMVNRAPGEELRVLLVQLDIPQVAGHVEWTAKEVHAGYEEETREALARIEAKNEELIAQATATEGEVKLESVDWVVWPEIVLYGPLLDDGGDRVALYEPSTGTVKAMRDIGVRTLIAGVWELEAERLENGLRPKEDGLSYNALLAVDPEGELAVHRKQHLVFYGEFIPFVDSVAWLGKVYEKVAGVAWAGNLGRGTGSEGFTLPGAGGEVKVIPSICFEDTVPRVTRKFSKEEREVIVNITNDGWFGESEGSRQHFQNALFRTIELRRPMMRAANRGVTGVVSATGSLVHYGTGERQILEDERGLPFQRGSVFGKVRVSRGGGPTLYARMGDWFAVLGLGVGVIWSLFKRFGGKKEEGVGQEAAKR